MSGDISEPLAAICDQPHPVADLARDYLAGGPEWRINEWFTKRAKVYFGDERTAANEAFSLENLTYSKGSPESRKVRLVSIRPYFFRGFQQLKQPIKLDADLVTVDGRNSSGKTSLAEAIEWLLSGNIQRREQGDPAELEHFIANRFRPESEKTWVECVIAVDGTNTKIRRVLVQDYGSSKPARCITQLIIDGEEMEGPIDLLDEYFAGVAPLLMQQTLREFVLVSPDNRLEYFETLLNIEEISDLIAVAQVSNQRLSDFPRNKGRAALEDWQQFTPSIRQAYFRTVAQYSKQDRSKLRKEICDALVRVAVDELGAKCESDIESCIAAMKTMQEEELRRRFPALLDFQPKEDLSKVNLNTFSDDSQKGRLQLLENARTHYLTALESQKTISQANVSIAKALEALRKAELIKDEYPQTCPICIYQPVQTLTKTRIEEIKSWDPIRERVERAKERFESAITECRQIIEVLKLHRENLVPPDIPQLDITDIGNIANSESYVALLAVHSDAKRNLLTLDGKISLALTALNERDPELYILETLHEVFSRVHTLGRCAEEYARKHQDFQQYLNELATSNEDYRTRDIWLKNALILDEFICDIQWEAAKVKAQKELSTCRDLLIDTRHKFLELRRKAFNEGITCIWSKLRRDEYLSFSELIIPQPRGRGQKARIEVKAKLRRHSETHEVHALSVLSESQINALGIASFVTRSDLLGHKVLVFDDPVQSMDDEHFRSFADDVLSHLCDNGFQVIVLTHNENFARDVSNWQSDRKCRHSMKITHTPKKGITVYEGNRSVTGLLNMSSADWEDGKYESAWICVRKAIERLYILIRMKHGQQPFEWRKWKGFTIERMWKESIRDLLNPLSPDIARRLLTIANMTASGAHIRQAEGETNFRWAVDTIRELHCKMDVGD